MSQKWYRLKCINIWILALALALPYGTPLRAAPKVKPPSQTFSLPPLLREVESRYKKSSTVSADFSQLNENTAFSQKKKSSGKILFKRPSKFRWETLKPDENLLVSDGKRFWFYTPPFDPSERGQVVVKKSSEVQSKLATALLTGSFSMTKNMTIKKQSESVFILVPKPGTAGTISQAAIEINPREKLIQKVILEHKGGNHTEIALSNIQLGGPIKDDLFVFTIPPNTDKLDDLH